MANCEPITAGAIFGRWTILSEYLPGSGRRGHANCRCRCGTERDVYVHSLLSGMSTSCGCVRKEGVYSEDGSQRRCTKCVKWFPLEMFPKHGRESDKRSTRCKGCLNSARAELRRNASSEDKDRALALARKWKRDNRARNLEKKREWEARNPEKVSQYSRKTSAKLRAANRRLYVERSLASRAKKPDQYKAYNKRWAQENAARCRAKYKAYMASKARAVPSWSDEFDRFVIEEMYDKAQALMRITDSDWHIDHIVPLRSKMVCGLHVHTNLRVIPGRENVSKGNRHWPDMWPVTP